MSFVFATVIGRVVNETTPPYCALFSLLYIQLCFTGFKEMGGAFDLPTQ